MLLLSSFSHCLPRRLKWILWRPLQIGWNSVTINYRLDVHHGEWFATCLTSTPYFVVWEIKHTEEHEAALKWQFIFIKTHNQASNMALIIIQMCLNEFSCLFYFLSIFYSFSHFLLLIFQSHPFTNVFQHRIFLQFNINIINLKIIQNCRKLFPYLLTFYLIYVSNVLVIVNDGISE